MNLFSTLKAIALLFVKILAVGIVFSSNLAKASSCVGNSECATGYYCLSTHCVRDHNVTLGNCTVKPCLANWKCVNGWCQSINNETNWLDGDVMGVPVKVAILGACGVVLTGVVIYFYCYCKKTRVGRTIERINDFSDNVETLRTILAPSDGTTEFGL